MRLKKQSDTIITSKGTYLSHVLHRQSINLCVDSDSHEEDLAMCLWQVANLQCAAMSLKYYSNLRRMHIYDVD